LDITLEKIDIIRSRTGVSYQKAKEALEHSNGDVVDALIYLENQEKTWKEEITVKSSELISRIKQLVYQGNITKIKVKHGDKVLVDIPVTAGAVGVLLAPQIAILAVIAALVTKCTLEIYKREGNNKEQQVNPSE
jgi:DNA-binding transcriptional MerR regulator